MKAVIYSDKTKPLFYGSIEECIFKRNEIEPFNGKAQNLKIMMVKREKKRFFNLI